MTVAWYISFMLACLAGMLFGSLLTRNYIFGKVASGTCVRADDGEVYLMISEQTQRALADPGTKLLYLRVIDKPTRKNPPL